MTNRLAVRARKNWRKDRRATGSAVGIVDMFWASPSPEELLRLQNLEVTDPEFWSIQAQYSRMQERADGTCWNCRKRPADTLWVGDGGAFAQAHGMGSKWCSFCTTEASLKYAKEQAARIQGLEQKLSELEAIPVGS